MRILGFRVQASRLCTTRVFGARRQPSTIRNLASIVMIMVMIRIISMVLVIVSEHVLSSFS